MRTKTASAFARPDIFWPLVIGQKIGANGPVLKEERRREVTDGELLEIRERMEAGEFREIDALPPVPSVFGNAGCQLMSWKLPTTAQTLSAGALISTVSVTF